LTTVSVLFPSSFPRDEIQIEQARDSLESHSAGLCFHWPRSLRARGREDHTDYLAGSDQDRCEEIVEFLTSAFGIAWFGRGGFGLTRILHLLEPRVRSLNLAPKRWMGYSDITALFALCKSLKLSVECVHGPMLCAFPRQPNKETVLQALRGKAAPIPLAEASPDLEFHGTIWGGNLAVLASLAGTPWLPTPEAGSAVLLEDVDEAPYRVDRYLTQLFHSGFFSQTRKVFLGTFTGFEPASAVYEVAQKRCQELGLRLLGRIPIGHSEPHTPLFLDKPYRFSPTQRCLNPNFSTLEVSHVL